MQTNFFFTIIRINIRARAYIFYILLEVLQIKYDINISKLYGVYKHTEENDQVHHIKKAKEISEFIVELFFEWKNIILFPFCL